MSEVKLSVRLAGVGLYRVEPVGNVEEQKAVACLLDAAPAMYEFIEAKAHHLPIEDQHVAALLLESARGK